MNQKQAIMALLKEIFTLMDDDDTPAKPSWPPTKRMAPRNGSALALLSLILGILLGVIAALVLKGCTLQNACVIGSDSTDPMGILDVLGDIEFDTDSDEYLNVLDASVS